MKWPQLNFSITGREVLERTLRTVEENPKTPKKNRKSLLSFLFNVSGDLTGDDEYWFLRGYIEALTIYET